MERRDDITPEGLLPLIEKHRGNIANIARHFGVTRRTIYNRIKSSEECQAALSDAREAMLDTAENALYDKVAKGETTELLFFLKTQGRSRGYVERVDHGAPDGPLIKVVNGIDPDQV